MAALNVECDRLVALGATLIRRCEPAPPMSAGFIVMTDPEGNEFCLD
jgi:predicted enzyme related to lactoylglutathione lyase